MSRTSLHLQRAPEPDQYSFPFKEASPSAPSIPAPGKRSEKRSRVAPRFILKDLEKLFQYKIFKMLLPREKVTEDLIEMLPSWRHSGFNV